MAVDGHKTESQVAVLDDRGDVFEEVRVNNDELGEIAEQYAGSEAALEATSNYFTIYDTLAENLDVTLANPVKAHWLDGQTQKDDRVDAKQLARFLRLEEVPASFVPPKEMRRYRALVRGRKKLVEKQTDCKNEVRAVLDQNGVTFDGSLWSDEGREFLDELTLPEPADLLLVQWLLAIDALSEQISRLDAKITERAAEADDAQLPMDAPGVAAFSGMMIIAELGDIERFAGAKSVVSYAGLAPSVRQSGDIQTERSITKNGSPYLRWILFECAQTAVHVSKDPYLSEFYNRLREKRNKTHKEGLVATARKLLVSLYYMLTRKEGYDPPGVTD